MANYLALIAISKNDLISFLFQQLIKTQSLEKQFAERDIVIFHARNETTSLLIFTVCA